MVAVFAHDHAFTIQRSAKEEQRAERRAAPGRAARPYTFGMTATTIKVSAETRDRLKQQAAAAGMSLGAYVSLLSKAAAREERLAALGAAIAQTGVGDALTAETAKWEVTELTDAR